MQGEHFGHVPTCEAVAPAVSHRGHFMAACAIISDAKLDGLVKAVVSARSCPCKGIF